MISDLKFLSLNVKGLNSPRKRRLLFRDLKRKSANIAFLQETRISTTAAFRLADPSYSRVFTSCAIPKRNGAAILLHNSCPLQIVDVYSDSAGRYVLARGTCSSKWYTLMSVYAPNGPDAGFWADLSSFLRLHAKGKIILGGDFNATLCSPLDRSGHPPHAGLTSSPSQDKQFHAFVRNHDLVDIWRVQHPTTKDFTFYSPVHSSYSRLDYFLISPDSIPLITTSGIGSITWSDHADVFLHVRPLASGSSGQWKLDPLLLLKKGVRKAVGSALDSYLLLNDTPDVSIHTLWNAHKAVIRGVLISQAAYHKRVKLQDIVTLQTDLRRLELRHKRVPTDDTLAQLNRVRADLNGLFLDDVGRSLLWSKRRYYERANKADTPLARMLRPRHRTVLFPLIRDKKGQVHKSPEAIRDAFTEYFTNIYNHSPTHEIGNRDLIDSIEMYLKHQSLPTLDKVQSILVGSPITEEEIGRALGLMKPLKAPGPDGFTYRYYKAFYPKLKPILCRLFNAAREGAPFPAESLLATIVLLPKPGKDPENIDSYRPISLLNTDIKLLAKILALRLDPLLPVLVSPDQVGFIPGRQAYDNTRRAADLVWFAETYQRPSLFLSLDAEKAFDRAEWPFLFTLLKHLGFPPTFLRMLSALYASPGAQILIPGADRIPFEIRNGTRQGCPLSPALFALFLEPLLLAIKSDAGISGLTVGDLEFKLSAYADDVLLSLTDPPTSLPRVMDLLGAFSALSGYKINITKSEALPVALTAEAIANLSSSCPIRFTQSELVYLGVRLTSCSADLYSANYPRLFATLKAELECWNKYAISWLGRLNCIKMNVLPRLLYMFQALPVPLVASEVIALQRSIDHFIWAGKRRRVA
uniref:Reverse transcriptase domain-containing protein n=1 Tax=Leptobrachium leishanense TaxID=445787 RepID=A0A8C5MVW3_9ANUR